jgi:hypothetical protein
VSRSQFLILAAIVPGAFGLVMMVAPDLMLANSLAIGVDASTRVVTQWVGFAVFSLALVNFLSRNDPGSPALRAVMLGNVVFHALGIGFDTYDYLGGFMKISGLVSGVVPHALLAVGFVYYLVNLRGEPKDTGGML